MPEKILIYDDHKMAGLKLASILGERFSVEVAKSIEELKTKCQHQDFHLFLLDIETLTSDLLALSFLRSSGNKAAMALITDLTSELYLRQALEWRIFNVFIKLPTYIKDRTVMAMENFLYPQKAFGLGRYLSGQIYQGRIKTKEDKQRQIGQVINHFATTGFAIHQLYDVRLVLEELINNAILHAFTRTNGREKYNSAEFQKLQPGEYIEIEYAVVEDQLGLSVTDNAGRLSPEQIVKILERQYDRTGLLDQAGRGLYLSRILSEEMVFNIKKARLCQIIALFKPIRSNRSKPIYINYVE